MLKNNDTSDTAELARRRAVQARLADLRSRKPGGKKRKASANTSTFGAIGAKGTTGKRKPPQFAYGDQGHPVDGAKVTE